MIDHSESLPCDVRALTHSINTTGAIPQYFDQKICCAARFSQKYIRRQWNQTGTKRYSMKGEVSSHFLSPWPAVVIIFAREEFWTFIMKNTNKNQFRYNWEADLVKSPVMGSWARIEGYSFTPRKYCTPTIQSREIILMFMDLITKSTVLLMQIKII